MPAHQFQSIVFLDDILRKDWWPAKEFFYDMIASCLQFNPQVEIKRSFRHVACADDGAIRDELYNIFQTYNAPDDQQEWVNAYEELPQWLQAYVQDHVKGADLVIGYELPEALRRFLESKSITYIDFRISPIRFCTDLIISFHSNNPQIMALAEAHSIPQQEVQHEANLRRASFLHRYRYAPQPFETAPDLLYIGQTPFDTSIVRNANYARLPEFMTELQRLPQDAHILYKKHPDAPQEFSETEVNCFKALGFSVSVEHRNTYDLLCMAEVFDVLTLSSSVAFEAPFFGRQAITLLPAPPWVRFAGDEHEAGYYQLNFDSFVNPDFWCALTAAADLPVRRRLWDVQPDRLRRLHNVWWAYAEHVAPTDRYIWMAKNDMHHYFHGHINGHEARLNGIDGAIQGHETRMNGIDEAIQGHETRMNGIDEAIQGHETRMGGIDGSINGHEERFQGVDHAVRGAVHSVRSAHQTIQCIFDDLRHIQTAFLSLTDLDKHPFSKALFDQLSCTKWWFGENLVELRPDYSVVTEDSSTAVWYVNAQQEIVVLWAMGRFIDRLSLSKDAQKMTGKNLEGHPIEAKRAE